MIKIFIVILNWNRKKDTLDCLKTIEKLIIKDFILDVVVVDNASTDGSLKALKSYKPIKEIGFHLIKNKKNIGFAAGNNVGMRFALKKKADYIMLLNNDTLVGPSLIVELLRVAKRFPKAGVFSPKMYFAKGFEYHKKRYKKSELGKVIWYAGGDIDWNNVYGTNHGVDEVDNGQFDKTRDTDFASGACMFIRSIALKKIGLFDERYYMYLEDGDLSQRMKEKGWRVIYAPKAVIWHKVAQSSGIGSGLNDYFITRNRMLFGILYAPKKSKLALIKESWKLLLKGRKWQKVGVKDFYLSIYGQGSWRA